LQLGEAAQVLGDGCQGELELSSAQPTEPQNWFQVNQQHLNALAVAARLLESLGGVPFRSI